MEHIVFECLRERKKVRYFEDEERVLQIDKVN
jgi:hypothetical protein